MTQFTFPARIISRIALGALVVVPLTVIGVLTVKVLIPTLSNSESKIYASGVGYPATQRRAGEPIKVQTVQVSKRSLQDGVAAPGESVPLQQVDVRPEVTGPVQQVHVNEGEWVRKGQPLLTIDRRPFQNAVDTARNNLAISQSNLASLQRTMQQQLAVLQGNIENLRSRAAVSELKLKQTESIAKEGAISQFDVYNNEDIYRDRVKDLGEAERDVARTRNDLDRQIEATRLQIQNNQITLQNALTDLNKTVVYASNDALVSQINIHSGDLVVARQAAPVISLTQNIVFKAYVDQARLDAIRLGDRATIRLVAYPGRTYEGKVIRLNPSVETNETTPGRVGVDRQYTYSVWVQIPLQMPPGLQGYAQFNQKKAALVIPENSVTHLSAGEGMVMVPENGQAVIKRVRLGRIFDNQREVLGGLAVGQRVVVNPRALNPGDKLEV
jgi:HlyD family secretion protein